MNRSAGSALSAVGISFLAGLCYCLLTYSPGFLSGRGVYWNMNLGDPGIHLTGARYYIQDEWRWPLFQTQNLNYPDGVNIIYTDSLPLMALPAKIFYHCTGIVWNYFGFWVLFSYLMFGLSIAFFLWSLNIRSLSVLIFSLLIGFCSFPFVNRIEHAALNSHFILITALGLYFFLRRFPTHRTARWGFSLLTAVSLWIHAYLFTMVFLLLLLTAICLLYQAPRNKKTAILIWPAVTTVMLVLLMIVSGHLSLKKEAGYELQTSGGGNASMNMVGPVFPPPQSPLHVPLYQDPTGKQYTDGLNYLGIGVLLLWLMLLFKHTNRLWNGYKKHGFLLLLCAGLYIYSLSYRIYFAHHEFLNLSFCAPLKYLYQLFRGNGRFFWPVFYLLLLLPAVLNWKWTTNHKKLITLLISLVIFQNLEILPLRLNTHSRSKQNVVLENDAFYESIIPKHQLVLIDQPDSETPTIKPRDIYCIFFLSGKYNIPTNYVRSARRVRQNTPFSELVKYALDHKIPTLFVIPHDKLETTPFQEDQVFFQKANMCLISTALLDPISRQP